MIDKTQLEAMYRRSMKTKRILFIISIVLFSFAVVLLTGFLVFYFTGYDVLLMPDVLEEDFYLSTLLLDFFDTCLAAGVVTMLFSQIVFARRARFARTLLDNYDQNFKQQSQVWGTKPSAAPIVDVKPVQQESRFAGIIKEYEKLYEQGLITKEDLEKKKTELQ